MSDKDQAASALAARHYEIEPGITRIFRVSANSDTEGLPNEPIKLLEVNAETAPTGILPLHFGPAPASGIPFPSVIIEVTPDEYERLQNNQMQLPHGWTVCQELTKETGNGKAG